jgi:hypothetical protein
MGESKLLEMGSDIYDFILDIPLRVAAEQLDWANNGYRTFGYESEVNPNHP